MSDLAVIPVDTHRLDLRFGRWVLAYAVHDAYGWVLMARRPGQGRVEAFDRFDPVDGDRPGGLRRAVYAALANYGQVWSERYRVDGGSGPTGRTAWTEYCAKWRSAVVLADDDPRHGLASTYTNYSCRCRPCTDAATAYRRNYGRYAGPRQLREAVS